MKITIAVCCLFLFFNVLAILAPVFSAAAPTFSDLPSSINSEDEIEISVNFSGDPRYYKNKTYYLRGVFFQKEERYCGWTLNNTGEWINTANEATKLYSFTTDNNASWSGEIKVKVDTDSSNFSGSGEYYFSVGRYTAGGSPSWSDTKIINITAPVPLTTEPLSQPTLTTEKELSSNNPSLNTTPNPSDINKAKLITSTSSSSGATNVLGAEQYSQTDSPFSTYSANFNIKAIQPLVASKNAEVDSTYKQSQDIKQKSSSTAWFLFGGGIMLFAGIAPEIWKRYNKKL